MRDLKLRRPTPALVVSVIALSVALGGTSYAAIVLPANSVGTRQIKKNAVTTAKVKNGSLQRADFGAGQLPAGATGATGATGTTGITGAAGPKGDSGANGTANVVMRESASTPVTPSAIVSVTVPCLAGERATGGGYDASGNGEFGTVALDSQPTVAAGVPNGWTVKVNNVTTLSATPSRARSLPR